MYSAWLAAVDKGDSALSVAVPLEVWAGLAVSLLLGLAGSRVLSAFINNHWKSKSWRKGNNRKDARAALESLRTARNAYRQYGSGGKAVDPKRDRALDAIYTDLHISAAATTDGNILELVKEYVEIGQRYASRDVDTSTEDEELAFSKVVEELRAFSRKKN
jgi:hypothetical protein